MSSLCVSSRYRDTADDGNKRTNKSNCQSAEPQRGYELIARTFKAAPPILIPLLRCIGRHNGRGDSIEGKKLSNYRISRHRPCGSRLVLMKTLPVSVSLCDAFYIADCNAIRLARSSPDFIYIVGNFIIALVTNERLIEPMYRSFRKITE